MTDDIDEFKSMKASLTLLREQYTNCENEKINKYIITAKEIEPKNIDLNDAIDSCNHYRKICAGLTLDDAVNLKYQNKYTMREAMTATSEQQAYQTAQEYQDKNLKPNFKNDSIIFKVQYISLDLEQKREYRSILNYLNNVQLIKILVNQNNESLIDLFKTYELLAYIENNGKHFPPLLSRHNVRATIEAEISKRQLSTNNLTQDLVIESLIDFNVNEDVSPAVVTIKYHPALHKPITKAFSELKPLINKHKYEIKIHLDLILKTTEQLAQKVIIQLISCRQEIIKALVAYCKKEHIMSVELSKLSIIKEPALYQIASVINDVNEIQFQKLNADSSVATSPKVKSDEVKPISNKTPAISIDNYSEMTTPVQRISFRMKLNKLAEKNKIDELNVYLSAQSDLSLTKIQQQYALISTISVAGNSLSALDYRKVVKTAIEQQLDARNISYNSEDYLLKDMVEINFIIQNNTEAGQIKYHPILHDVILEQFSDKLLSNYNQNNSANRLYFDLDLTMGNDKEIMRDLLISLEESTEKLLDNLQKYCNKNNMKAKFDKSQNYSLYDIAKAVYKIESMLN